MYINSLLKLLNEGSIDDLLTPMSKDEQDKLPKSLYHKTEDLIQEIYGLLVDGLDYVENDSGGIFRKKGGGHLF
jgi:hypothetical protein